MAVLAQRFDYIFRQNEKGSGFSTGPFSRPGR
jgi:hypothetical protein